ncbi:hypothetical protein PTKIN_Ptkin01aG0004500 [Pterospermum kingtungense]
MMAILAYIAFVILIIFPTHCFPWPFQKRQRPPIQLALTWNASGVGSTYPSVSSQRGGVEEAVCYFWRFIVQFGFRGMEVLSNIGCRNLCERYIFDDGMEKHLIPFLDPVCRQDVPVVALQHLVDKHMYYFVCKITTTGCDPSSLDEILLPKAIRDACEAIASRHLLPESIWKLQKWLNIGKERRLSEAWITIDHLLSEYMSVERKELSCKLKKEEMNFSLLELIFDQTRTNRTIVSSVR